MANDNGERWTAEQTKASRATLRDDLQDARRPIVRITDRVREGRQWYLFSVAAELPRLAMKMIELRDPRRPRECFDWFELYCPHERVLQPIPRRQQSARQRMDSALIKPMRPVVRPLLPGYAFGRFDFLRDPWRDLFGLAGLRGIACEDDKPVPLLPGVVEGLRGLEVDGAVPGSTSIKALPVEVGEEIRIAFGPFAGHNGTIETLPDVRLQDLDESAKLKVLVAGLFGHGARVELSIGDIAKL